MASNGTLQYVEDVDDSDSEDLAPLCSIGNGPDGDASSDDASDGGPPPLESEEGSDDGVPDLISSSGSEAGVEEEEEVPDLVDGVSSDGSGEETDDAPDSSDDAESDADLPPALDDPEVCNTLPVAGATPDCSVPVQLPNSCQQQQHAGTRTYSHSFIPSLLEQQKGPQSVLVLAGRGCLQTSKSEDGSKDAGMPHLEAASDESDGDGLGSDASGDGDMFKIGQQKKRHTAGIKPGGLSQQLTAAWPHDDISCI